MKQRLTQKEEEVMNIIWQKGDVFIRDIVSQMPEPMANSFIYTPAISEKEYRGSAVRAVVAKYYNNSYASMVSQFVEEEKLNLDELKALISQIERQKK